jgi:hypothetical protein
MSSRFLLAGGPSSIGGDDGGEVIRVSGTGDVAGRLLDGVEACTSLVIETLSTCMSSRAVSESLISESLSLLRKENKSLDAMLKCEGPDSTSATPGSKSWPGKPLGLIMNVIFTRFYKSLVVYRISTRACHSYWPRESGVRLPARELIFCSLYTTPHNTSYTTININQLLNSSMVPREEHRAVHQSKKKVVKLRAEVMQDRTVLKCFIAVKSSILSVLVLPVQLRLPWKSAITGPEQTFWRLRLGLTPCPILCTPSSEVSFRWIIVFLFAQVVSPRSITLV